MACVNCQRIRSAILHGKMAEAAGLSVAALREKIGFKVDDAEPAAAKSAVVGELAPEPILPEAKASKGK